MSDEELAAFPAERLHPSDLDMLRVVNEFRGREMLPEFECAECAAYGSINTRCCT